MLRSALRGLAIAGLTLASQVGLSADEPRQIQYQTTSEDFLNPERGFLKFRNLVQPSGYAQVRAQGHSIIYGQVLASSFRDGPLSDEFLQKIQSGFDAARENGLKVKFRLSYSNDIGQPDAPKAVVLQHIQQLAPLWERNKDVMFHMDAGFIGAWGEWHSSTNGLTNPTDRSDILHAILDALPVDRSVSVRTPHFKREIFTGSQVTAIEITSETAFDGSDLSRVGHVNDCFLSSPTDVGTYINPGGQWPVSRELEYIGNESKYVAFGGETCGLDARNESARAIAEMQQLHIDYLNLDWHPDVIQRWKDEGKFAEISRNIGYRYQLNSVALPDTARIGGVLNLQIDLENVGFGELFNGRKVEVVLRNNQTAELTTTALSVDPRRWTGGEKQTLTLQLALPETLANGTYTLGLWLPDADSDLRNDVRYAIRFANENVWDPISGVNWLSNSLHLTRETVGVLLEDASSLREIVGNEALLGDFDGDGDNDVADIDALAAAIRAQSNDLRWDLDGDERVSSADQTTWVRVIKYTTAGDATLDGTFDSTDLVQAFQAGRYETGLAAGWAEGDWTGDGLFDSGDLVAAFTAGGYEAEAVEVTVVPEPTSSAFAVTAFAFVCGSVLRRRVRGNIDTAATR